MQACAIVLFGIRLAACGSLIRARSLLTLSFVFLSVVWVARAQVSPGVLSHAHESLDSPLKCTSCHSFGQGAAKLKCQWCHREIHELVAARNGYHGRVVDQKKGDIDCARCHTEHYGVNFSIIRWPTSKDEFDHRTAGYALEGRHKINRGLGSSFDHHRQVTRLPDVMP